MKQVTIKANGKLHSLSLDPNRTLVEVLREDIGLTGTKQACDTGGCGTCTVIINGRPVYACLVLAIDCEGKDIMTIEGLASDGELHPIQKAFIKYGAIQCGFCTPGMVMSAKALLDENPNPTREEVKRALAGNLCRCTGYIKIVDAVLAAAEEMRKGGS